MQASSANYFGSHNIDNESGHKGLRGYTTWSPANGRCASSRMPNLVKYSALTACKECVYTGPKPIFSYKTYSAWQHSFATFNGINGLAKAKNFRRNQILHARRLNSESVQIIARGCKDWRGPRASYSTPWSWRNCQLYDIRNSYLPANERFQRSLQQSGQD